jgi:peptidoglycan/xylan/chitin deacetylase (PgdA/CDA1 family)
MTIDRTRAEPAEPSAERGVGRFAAAAFRQGAKRFIPRSLAIRRLRPSPRPTILLTFDDGPHPDVTPAVLDRLATYGAQAAFFVIGRRAKRAAHVLIRTQQAGHAVGNHSHLHRRRYYEPGEPRVAMLDYYRDCVRCQSVISGAVGPGSNLFRPPGGYVSPTTLLVPKLLGLRCVLWSRYVKDWTFCSPGEARAGAEELLRAIAPRDIVLLHDWNPHILDLLDVLLPGLRDRGFDLTSGLRLL